MLIVPGLEYMNQRIKYSHLSSLKAEEQAALEQSYLQSFPASERRSWADLARPQHAEQEALALYYSGRLCGMLHLWRMAETLFVEYFFVLEPYRNAGLGHAVIADLIGQLLPGQRLVLEAEPAEAGEWASRRLAFYERCGLLPLELQYYQPAFDRVGGQVLLHLLSSSPMGAVEARATAERIHRLVYGSEFILSK